ncbi:uncharacterized protein BDW43DRAFT_295320 [Aspergillus alliaceus]|uniref:uncharacterized protein n=1 Tax=Petromyces alliaceus TaxID=209559 RepID=UPI0012A55AD5|nr:uncharacterized protein BDW43DRAFT_295320 [Aspergillus alliaceus]KAB8226953.1 hypothetical protein BDW43DRAFT_295320 [Aspergillus alliaceus]
MSISKLTNSALNFGLEVSPALANLNFDFSVFRLNVEPEYQAIGEALSCSRRREAEQGRPQVTARKLAQLFAACLPRAPNLIKAYGKRASEIIEDSKISNDQRAKYGVFAEQAGPDATSLWAASTSGSHAVAVHLLACMLARMWDAAYAVSIWVEIVEERRREIEKELEDTSFAHTATLVAARCEISREQLAEWDASTRAWLRIADKSKSEQVKNLSLIMDQVRLPVNTEEQTFASVMGAWKTSLINMDALLIGKSQGVKSGELLLAAYSWHLFPYISSVSTVSTGFVDKDPLFPSSATITIGLDESPMVRLPKDKALRQSVYWSLPLARVRQYGPPIRCMGTLDSRERDRLSVKEFLHVFLGSYLRGWREIGLRTKAAVGLLSEVEVLLAQAAAFPDCPEATALIENPESWLALLFEAANEYRTSVGNQRLRADSLVSLGRRYADEFLGTQSVSLADLLRQGQFVNLVNEEEVKIQFLRKVALEMSELLGHKNLIIRCKQCYGSTDVYEYATALPLDMEIVNTEDGDGNEKKRKLYQFLDNSGHRRWLCAGGGLWQEFQKIDGAFYTYEEERDHTAFSSIDEFFSFEEMVFPEVDQRQLVDETYRKRKARYESLGEVILKREDLTLSNLAKVSNFESNYLHQTSLSKYTFLYGDEHSTALFVLGNTPKSLSKDWISKTDLRHFSSLSELGSICPSAFARSMYGTLELPGGLDKDTGAHSSTALKAVSIIMKLYKSLPTATIDVRILQKYVVDSCWFRKYEKRQKNVFQDAPTIPESLQPYPLLVKELERDGPDSHTQQLMRIPESFDIGPLDLTEAFSCIALFDSGKYDVHPEALENTIAMSSTDSLYVSASILSDPWDQHRIRGIVHIEGNIGRPGVSFLVPPPMPMVKDVRISEWPQMSDQVFDGNLKDEFSNTSLHLRFTGDSSKVDAGSSHVQDSMVQAGDAHLAP